MTILAPLLGCWHRSVIRFAGGKEDALTRAIWLQTASGMADLRIAANRPDFSARRSLADCTRLELLALAEQDAMCGITLFDPHALPYPTATWPAQGSVIRFQPVTAFPEPGWLEFRDNGTVMIERAPSGAYQEEWRLQPGSSAETAQFSRRHGSVTECLYVAGDHALYARGRNVPVAEQLRLPELARAARDDVDRLRALVDCEFSYARRAPGSEDFVVALSTLPWREGSALETIPCLSGRARS